MPVAFPTEPWPERVHVRPDYATAQFDNPLTKTVEVQTLGPWRWAIDVHMQPMRREEAAVFAPFILALEGGGEVFGFDLTPWCPGVSPPPGTHYFRLAAPDTGWDAEMAVLYGFAFSALEDTLYEP